MSESTKIENGSIDRRTKRLIRRQNAAWALRFILAQVHESRRNKRSWRGARERED